MYRNGLIYNRLARFYLLQHLTTSEVVKCGGSFADKSEEVRSLLNANEELAQLSTSIHITKKWVLRRKFRRKQSSGSAVDYTSLRKPLSESAMQQHHKVEIQKKHISRREFFANKKGESAVC